jgi:hypothetical protein
MLYHHRLHWPVVLVAEVFADAGASMIGEARYIVDAGNAATCVKCLPADNQRMTVRGMRRRVSKKESIRQ